MTRHVIDDASPRGAGSVASRVVALDVAGMNS
jgi:hypothetical protein